ncbi:universal stress protein [Metabacillus herbersteinensis]|uniref:Universal stress protein n=1 Tax=Metabacillus herbersteinensis TaxID=283816 RepID=A0ABV6GJ41_9BACI
MFKKILLAADGSSHSLRAAEKAIELAKCNPDTSIEVIYIVDGKTSKEDVLYNWNTLETESKRKEKMAFIEKRAQKDKVKYEIKIIRGEPGPSIVKYANENMFDLVVIGSRGLNTMQEMVLGSVSHKVTKRAKCPVLIVK